MAEEVEKSSMTSEEQSDNNKSRVRGENNEQEDLEEGEIINDDDDAASSAKAIVNHPLEHSWTFWFDNASAKSKQTAWGSSMRTIYTFSTVEEFWRYTFLCSFY